MKSSTFRTQGELVADFLAGSWRERQASLDIPLSDLERVTTLLYNSGGAGLAWWRIHESDLKTTPCGELLHQGYRLQALQTPIHEERIVRAYRLLRGAEVEPILVKGWATAQFYPHRTLRPYGDIDLLVRPEEYSAAREVLKRDEAGTWWVDLHKGLSELDDRSVDGLFERSHTVTLNDLEIRVLSHEDHLALLAIHLFKHGAWRPLWLCDLGLLLESMSEKFDWKLCLGRSKRHANWILAAVGLAHTLLGAQIGHEEIAARARSLPAWLPRSVLKEWETPFAGEQPPMSHRAPMRAYLRHPAGLIGDLANRWPNPILATVSVKGKFNRLPRFPYQLANCLRRSISFVTASSPTKA